MATKIKKTNGDVLVTIPEGEIDASATPLELIGEGAEDWIVAMNQNWVRSLENFAGSTPPVAPLLGQFWFDTATRTVKFWDGDEWLFLNGRSESTEDDAEDVGVPSEEGVAGIDQTILDAIEAAKVEIEAALAEGQRLYEERERLAADARAAAEALLQDGQDLLNDRVDDAFAQLSLVDPLAGSIGERVIQHQQAIDGQAILIAAVESVADNANAAVLSLSQAITDADYATAEDLTVVRSALEDDLAATNAQVSFLANTVSGGNGSISILIEGVRTDFEAADADLTSEIFELRQTTTTATEAAADRLDLIETDINTATTGLKAKMLSHTTTLADLNTNKVSIGDFQILEAKAVAKAKTYVGTTLPTNVPAGTLTAGDIFYKTNENNRVYRWSGTAWAPVDDTRSPTFVGATAPAAGVSRLGDLWVKTPENLLYRFDGTNWIKFEDPRVGQVVATVQSHTDVIADLPNNYAGATVFNQIKSEVEGARNGKPNLAAEIGNVRQVITDGLNLKASAADLNLLKAEVDGARNGSANLSAQLLAMRTATSDGLALKATATDVDTIRTEIRDARNGSPNLSAQLTSMRTATSDGLALKAAASDFNLIKAEVEGARNGSANLNAQLQTMRTVVSDGLALKATATEVNTIRAELVNARNGKANLSAELTSMRTATSDGLAGKAAATRVDALEVAARSLPNLIKNGDFTNGLTNWERDGAGPASDIGTYYHNTLGTIGWIKGAVGYIASDLYRINPGNPVSLSFEGERGGGDGTACIQWLPGYAQTGHVAIPTQWGIRAKSENNVAPAGTTHFRVVIGKGTATQIHFARVKVNADAVATNWSNEASVFDTNARIGVVETVTTNGTFATANRVNDLQATLQTRNNLCPNGGLENGLTGLTGPSGMTLTTNGWGPQVLVYNTGTGTQVINFPKFSVFGGNWYTISGDTVLFAASNHSAYLDLIFFDAAGNVVQDGPEKAIYGQHDFSNAPSRLQDHAAQTLAPANAVTAQARAVFSATNATVIGVRRVKVEMGQLPATQYTAEASGVQAGARIKVVEDVTTNGTFATASTTSQISARVDAQGGNLLINTDFQSGTGGWSPGGQVVTPLIVNGAGDPWHPVGENVIGFNVQGNAGYSDINSDRVSVEPGKWYDLSAYIACHRANANMYIGWFNAAGTNLGYNDGPGEFVPGAGGQNLAGFTRRWFKAQAPANAAYAFVIFRKMATNQSNDSWMWVCRPMFGECSASTTSVRPFSHGNARQLAGLITDARNIAVDTRGRVQATAGLTVQAGSRVAGMKFHATDGSDQSYSSIDFNADTFRVWDTNTNTGIPPFEIRNGGVRMKSAFVDRLSVGTSITLGSGIQFRVAVQPIDVSVTDGQSVNFGYDLGANPTLQFAGNNLAPLNAGETYNLYAENLSPTGFIARLKISTPATPSNLNTGLMGASANGPTTHHAYLDQYGGRTNSGSYNVRVVGYNRVYRNRFQNPGGYYEYQPDDPYNEVQGETWITVYGWNGGAWVELSTIWIGPTFSGANGYTDQYFDQTESVQTGSNISHIGVAVTNRTFAESRVDNLGINWQTQGAGGGLRSATPNGQVSSVTIRPRT